MRRPLIGAAGAAVLVLGLVPGAATAKTFQVDGGRYASSGLTKLSQGCVDSRAVPVTAPDLKIRRGPGNPPIGKYSSGWLTHGAGFGAGAETRISSPSTVDRFRIRLYSPSDKARGHAVVRYHPPGDSGYWFGNADLGADTEKGWHRVNATNRVFTWTHFTAEGAIDRTGPDDTLTDFVAAYGGDGDGADLGFVFGCDERVFFVDALEVRSDADDKVFDFGGFRSRALLLVGSHGYRKVTIDAGQRLELRGRLYEKYQDIGLPGKLRFESRPLSGGSYRTFFKKYVAKGDRAITKVAPKRSTAYRISYAGSDTWEGDFSEVLKVVVRLKVGARLVDDTITKGQSFTVAGSVTPGKRTRIRLQRFLGDGRWTTVKQGRTAGDGDYRIGAKPSRAGGSYWRIKAAGGSGNVGNVSRNLKLTVKQPSDGGDNPPPPPDDTEPPPPPPPPPPPEG